jgi:signal transduction histidine kinase/ligand-binding sensor domain-containing protein
MIRVFDTESGLPHNRVNKIYRDSKDFLWICTDDGLSRFDGHQFANYTTANGLPHRFVNALMETRTGEYWVATDGGLSRFDPRAGETRFTTYAPSGPVEASHINDLIEDSDGSFLLGTSFGLYRFGVQRHSPVFERINVDSSSTAPDPMMVNAIARDTRGSLWLATNRGLYQRGKSAGWTHYDRWAGADHPAFVSSFAKESNGRLWVAFKGGFGRIAIDPTPDTPALDAVHSGQPGLGRELRALWFGTDGRRWIATNNGLREWIIDSNGVSQFREHTIQDKFPHEAFLSIAEDIAGNLWFGTRRSGLLRMAPSHFQTFGATEGLQLGRDQLLLETQSGQVSVFDIGGKRSRIYQQGYRGQFVASVPALPEAAASLPYVMHMAIEDHKSAWWFSTIYGLFRFSALGGQSDLHLLPESSIDRFFEDSAGNIWISHQPHNEKFAKLARWDRHSGVVCDESERLPPDARMGIAAFAQDHAGSIWIGLQLPGRLLRLKNGRFQPISADWRGHINKLFVDSKGRLWATSTESSLGFIADPQSENPHLRRYTRAEGLSADEVWCVTEDRLGRIYAGTAKGVDRLDPGSGQVVHYATADGLVRGDIRSALRDRNGDLWFASAYGVSKFRPSADRAVPLSRGRIVGLRAAGVSLPLSDLGETEIASLQFLSHQNSLQIDFAATDYHVLAPLRYQFSLDHAGSSAADKAWRDAGLNPTVHLVNLAPGDYSFQVRALTPDDVTGEPARLSFAILQPFWRTWWFQLACGIAIALILYWLHKQRLQRQLAIERVRSHIAMDLHDDIGAGLARISVIGEALKSRLRAGDGEVQNMLDDIADSSRRLIADMSDIVWSLDPRRDHIGELASRLRAFGSDLLEPRGVDWTVDAPAESLHQSVSPYVRRQLYLIFKEGIHNIGKHSDARKARLRLWLDDGYVCGELTDNGCGITAGYKLGSGISSMRARIKQLAGTFEIAAPPDGGTRIRIHIPIARQA